MAGVPERELTAIAAVAAKVAPPDFREDCFQAAWERFLRYDPQTRRGAWLMARSARADVLREEGRQEKLRERLLAAPEAAAPPSKQEIIRSQNRRSARARQAAQPEKERRRNRARYWRDVERSRAQVRARVARHRARQRTPALSPRPAP